MLFRNLLRIYYKSNYELQFARLYRFTSRREYSTNGDMSTNADIFTNANNSAETQANNIQTHASINEPIANTGDTSMNAGKSNSFANRRRAIRDRETKISSQTVNQKPVPLPSSMLRNWEKPQEKLQQLQLNFWKAEPSVRSYQNVYISKLPISATRQDIEVLTRGIFPDNENPINKIFTVYNDYYKPTGSAWIQFNQSRNASLFVKCVNQKTFYGNKLNVELMKYIPEGVQTDPLNYRAGRCIILAGLPPDLTNFYLKGYLVQILNKNLELLSVSRNSASPSDTSKWLILLKNTEDTYFMFNRLHNRYFEDDVFYKMKARVVR